MNLNKAIDSRDEYLFDLYKFGKACRNDSRVYYILRRYQERFVVLLTTITSCAALLADCINDLSKEPTLFVANTVLYRLFLRYTLLEVLYVFPVLFG
jgi:hypothetical protein